MFRTSKEIFSPPPPPRLGDELYLLGDRDDPLLGERERDLGIFPRSSVSLQSVPYRILI